MIEEIASTSSGSPQGRAEDDFGIRWVSASGIDQWPFEPRHTAINEGRFQNRNRRAPSPTRRLRGFLISLSGRDARVGFVDPGGSVTEYLLPATRLKKAGITAVNQPFEMDEIEEETSGGHLSGYVFRPMAPADATVTDIFEVDCDLAELRDAALRHFGNPADD